MNSQYGGERPDDGKAPVARLRTLRGCSHVAPPLPHSLSFALAFSGIALRFGARCSAPVLSAREIISGFTRLLGDEAAAMIHTRCSRMKDDAVGMAKDSNVAPAEGNGHAEFPEVELTEEERRTLADDDAQLTAEAEAILLAIAGRKHEQPGASQEGGIYQLDKWSEPRSSLSTRWLWGDDVNEQQPTPEPASIVTDEEQRTALEHMSPHLQSVVQACTMRKAGTECSVNIGKGRVRIEATIAAQWEEIARASSLPQSLTGAFGTACSALGKSAADNGACIVRVVRLGDTPLPWRHVEARVVAWSRHKLRHIVTSGPDASMPNSRRPALFVIGESEMVGLVGDSKITPVGVLSMVSSAPNQAVL